jgi:NAD kinase
VGATGTTVFRINEIALTTSTVAAKTRVATTGGESLTDIIGDGLQVATPIDSTRLQSLGSRPVLPHGSSLFSLTGLASSAGQFGPIRLSAAVLQ